jgi:hypothetical protein
VKVFGYCNDPLPWTNPFPERTGFIFALRGGDYYSPDSWTTPTDYTRGYMSYPILPFFSARVGRFGFYIGWKVYGVDTENQRAMPGITDADVYDGSVAIQGFTLRFTSALV